MTEIVGADRAKNAALIVTSATSLGFGGGALATGISLGVQGTTLLPASYITLFVAAPVGDGDDVLSAEASYITLFVAAPVLAVIVSVLIKENFATIRGQP